MKSELSDAIVRALESAEIFDVNLIVDSNVSDLSESVAQSFQGTVKLRRLSLVKSKEALTNAATVLLMKNQVSWEKLFLPKLSAKNFSSEQIFILIFVDQTQLNASGIFKHFWKFHLLNANIIHHETNEITLLTYNPFSSRVCGSSSSMTVNSFVNGTWTNRIIFPSKTKDLHGCPIKVSTFDYPPAIIVDNSTKEVYGHDIDLIKGIARVMNFSVKIEMLDEPGAWGFLTENGSSGGVLKRIIDFETDIAVGIYYLTQTRAKFMAYSQYDSSQIVLVAPSGIPLSSFEKLYKPFSQETWIVLLLTFVIALLIIFVISIQSKSIQIFVFGRETGNPFVNLLSIVLNGSQHRMPNGNFSRTLLLLFVLFCIVIRTLYQAAMFRFLQTDQRHSEIQTIDELLERKFDIFMYESFQELSNGLKIHER